MTAPELETERLHLRMLQVEDFEEYAAIHTDPEVTRFTVRTQLDRTEAWRHLAKITGHWHLRGFGMWGLFEKATNRLVGRAGFHEPEGWPEFELGWTLGRAFWGKGYATEAAQRCLDYAFGELGRTRIISIIDPENLPSIRVAERLGYEREREWQHDAHTLIIYVKKP